MKANSPVDHLVRALAALPGLGPRSARRIALHLLTHKDEQMLPLARAIEQVADAIKVCSECGNLDVLSPCAICCDPSRDQSTLCIVAHVADLWAIERTHAFKGRYHILGGVLSALDGIGPHDLDIAGLQRRIEEGGIGELIVALGATVDGQSTAHYISDTFAGREIKITRLAHGLPVGGELDYLDDGTITTALRARAGF
ncbi:MAG: recombination protein RecR [Alphaproteobacteria bacterium]|nr:recombination protein RecR [Alphaproteobacteria bacterium]